MSKKMYTGQFQHLFDALALSIKQAQSAGGGAPVIVLASSSTLASRLKRRLVESGQNLWNVRFVSFLRLAQIILRSNSENTKLPLPELGDYLLVKDIVKEHRGYFAQAAEFPGFARTATESIRDLKEACVPPQSLQKISGDKMKAFAEIYAEYENRLAKSGSYDRPDFLAEAAKAAPGCAELTGARFICYGIYDMNGVQRRLFIAAAEAAASAEIFVPYSDSPAFVFAKPFVEWLMQKRFEPKKLSPALTLAEKLFTPPAKTPSQDGPAISIISAPGESAETRQIVREAAQLAESGVPLEEIAVLMRSSSKYGRLLRDAFARAGVPCTISREVAPGETPEGRGFILLAALLSREFDRRELMQFVNYAPLGFQKLLGTQPNIAAWETLALEAGAFARDAELLNALNWIAQKDDSRREHAASLITLLAMILEARRAMPKKGSWSGVIGALVENYQKFMLPGDNLSRVIEIVESLKNADRLGLSATLEDAVSASLMLLERTPRDRSGGVFVGDLLDSRGLGFRAVIIPGMAERIFPAAAQQDPILLDRERQDIRQRASEDAYLPLKGARAAEEKILFALAASAATDRLILTYPRLEITSGNELVPSHFLIRLIEATTGVRCDYSSIEKFDGFKSASLLPAGSTPADLHDYDCQRVAAHIAAGDASRAVYLSKINAGFGRSIKAERARWHARRFTEYDGLIGERAHTEPLSVSKIEKFAKCPFDYFVAHVLGVRPLEEADPLDGMTPRDAGSLFHRIVAAAYQNIFRGGNSPDATALQAALEQAADEAFNSCRSPKGPRLSWHALQRNMLRDLRKLAARDHARRQLDGSVPSMFEASFGMHDGSACPMLELEIAGKKYLFRGIIDRIDSVGRQIKVIDYKTGRVDCKDDSFNGGKNIQLPIYIFAAEKITGREVLSAEYWLTSTKQNFRSRSFSKEALEERMPDLEKIITTADGAIRAGVFVAVPNKKCELCDSRTVCGVNSDVIFARKQDDEVISPFIEMQKIL